MTLSQIIKLRTNSGRTIVDFLVDVMQDRFKDFRICHRLQAARLLTTYGNEDAPDFIADSPPDTQPTRNKPRRPRQTKFDTELARLIREDTDDGRSIARFLVNVMEGELMTFRPHHRMAAARELLDRGFGKTASTDPERGRPARTTCRSGEGRNPETSPSDDQYPGHIEASEPTEGDPTPNRRSGEGRNPETSPSDDQYPGHIEASEPTEGDPTPNRRSGEGRNPETSLPADPAKDSHTSQPTNQIKQIPESNESQFRQLDHPLTPHEASGLAADLIDTLHHIPPSSFEHTVLDLLHKMGYGRARHTGRSGDGGIDGIIDHDGLGLGLDSVCVQAKRWNGQVGEPEIRSFSGSLDPHGAARGILVTTSCFSESARRTAETISAGGKIIRLVDGRELAQLMIDYGVGVTTDTPHHARKNVTPYSDTGLDENYFNQHT